MNNPAKRPIRIHKYVEVADGFRRQVGSGELAPGDQLPSFTQMLKEHGIGQGTLERAYALLEQEGLIVRDVGRGTFVAEPRARKSPKAIGVVWSIIASQDPYVTQLMLGIQAAARKNDLELLFINHAHAVTADKVSGVIVTGFFRSGLEELPEGMPRVSLGQCHEGFPSVTSDDYQGTRDAIQYLLKQGHRRIGFLTIGCQKNSDGLSKQRFAAYNDTLREAGIAPGPDWVRPLFELGDRLHGWESFRDYGRQKMNVWLRQGWAKTGCTALLTQNDDAAIGAIEALQGAGIKVPRDVSVVGFDGTERAEYFSPRLTTVRVPLQAISGASVDLLAELIAGQYQGSQAIAERNIVLPTSLSIGGTTARAAGSRGRKAGHRPFQAPPDERGDKSISVG